MAAHLSDSEIARLLAERKPLPEDWRNRLRPKPKRGHVEAELDVTGADGSTFRLVLRRSIPNPLDFSAILVYCVPGTNQELRLRRYNARSHEHSNPIEGHRFYDFHIHTATERYQQSGHREDTYAEVTDRYADLDSALRCLLDDCNFDAPEDPQGSLFGGGTT